MAPPPLMLLNVFEATVDPAPLLSAVIPVIAPVPATEWTIPSKSLLLIETVAAEPPDLLIPVSAPEFAKAYLIQPRLEVPRALLSLVTDVVIAPVLVIPVTAVIVPEVAKPS